MELVIQTQRQYTKINKNLSILTTQVTKIISVKELISLKDLNTLKIILMKKMQKKEFIRCFIVGFW